MRAVVLDDEGRPQLVDVDDDDDAAPVLACGLCGSDVEKLSPEHAGAVLGHEVVADVGGRRVALFHHLPCGRCDRCAAGHESTCEQFAAPTIRPGGFAERVQHDGGVELPKEIDDAHGTYVEPLACVLRAAERIRPGGRVLIIGNGFVGRLFAAALTWREDEVFAVDTDPRRAGTDPDGPVDTAILCAPAGAETALAALHPGGTLVVFADAGAVPATEIYRRELVVFGSRSATPRHMEAAAALLPELDLPEPTVLPLEQFAEGLDLYRTGEALKVVFTP
jgi:L-iditol 2-dehydrogenase